MTVIRLLCDSTVEASANGKEIWGKHGPVHSDEFRIDYKLVAFYEWGALWTEFDEGRAALTGAPPRSIARAGSAD
jgi:hypothetical protein